MGMSSNKSKTKSNSTEKTTSTPTTPEWITQPLQNYAGKVTSYLNSDPAAHVAGAAPLQEKAFDAAGSLGGWKEASDSAVGMAQSAGAQPAHMAAGSSMQAVLAQAPKLGQAAQAGSVDIDPTTNAQAHLTGSESLLDNLQSYADPGMRALLDTTLADYDADTLQQKAQLEAAGARGGAFGGSRFGIAEGQFAADSARGRAATDAALRSQIYTQAINASNLDAQRRQDAGMTNAGLLTNVSGMNAGAANTRAGQQAGLDLQRLLANMDARNSFAREQAGLDAGAAEANAQRSQQAGMFNAGAQMDTSRFNAQQQEAAMQRALQAAGLISDIGSTAAGNARADVGLTADLGEMQRQIEQARLLAPLAQLQAAGQLYGAIPYGSYTGQQVNSTANSSSTSKTSPSLFNQMLAAAQTAAAFAPSDRRLKRDIEKVGTYGPLGLYRFNYVWDRAGVPERLGVMADEVARHRPDAMGPEIAGYESVDYARLGLAALVARGETAA